MKGIALMLSVTLALVLATAGGIYYSVNNVGKKIEHIFAQDVEETTKTVPFSLSGILDATTANGSITITGHDEPTMIINIIKKGKKEHFGDVAVEETIAQDHVNLNCNYRTKMASPYNYDTVAVSYEITLPKTTTVTCTTVNGALYITDVTGVIQSASNNGSVTCTDTPQVARAQTVNGSVTLETNALTVSSCSLQTVNGSIDFHAERLTSESVTLSSVNGSVSLEVPSPLTTEGSKKHLSCISGKTKIEASTVNGRISATTIAQTN